MMLPLRLADIADWTKGRLHNAQGDETFTGVCTDSRKVREDCREGKPKVSQLPFRVIGDETITAEFSG
jgi:hypothetical protein